jgi:hypothetical protein
MVKNFFKTKTKLYEEKNLLLNLKYFSKKNEKENFINYTHYVLKIKKYINYLLKTINFSQLKLNNSLQKKITSSITKINDLTDENIFRKHISKTNTQKLFLVIVTKTNDKK